MSGDGKGIEMLADELVELEHGFWEAAGDGGYYLEHMHEDGRCLLPVGVMDRSGTAAASSKAPPWASHRFENVEVHELTDGVAVLTYEATGTRSDSGTYEALISTTYLRDDSGWKLYLHQQTPLTAQT